MSEKRDSSKGPIRPGINQQGSKQFNEAPNQKQEQQWHERQQNDPMKQQAEREWEQAQRNQQDQNEDSEKK